MDPNLENKEQFQWTGLGTDADLEPYLLIFLNLQEAPVVSIWNPRLPGIQCEITKGKLERNILDL